MTTTNQKSATELLDSAIAELEARLNLKPGQPIFGNTTGTGIDNNAAKQQPKNNNKKEKQPKQSNNNNRNMAVADKGTSSSDNNADLPAICKLEFKVGIITKVWVHEKADKLYCEEIDVGEDQPRQIASGLRLHFTEEQMLGQRLLVVSNLKAKNLVGFKSHGMVLCAAEEIDGVEKVEFVEPPADAAIGEIITFDGLATPQPVSPNQVEKQKLFQVVMEDMKSTADCKASWKGQIFMTSAGPCTTKTIANGVLR